MACARPYTGQSGIFNCGSCELCAIRRKRQWVARLILEGMDHQESAFITLTFAEEHKRTYSWRMEDDGDKEVFTVDTEHEFPEGTVDPSDTQLFLKRLRKAWPKPIRFFAVGEYGDKSDRPHYHVIVFGIPHCRNGVTRQWEEYCCDICEMVRKAWPYGRIEVGTATDRSIGYCAGYAAKKLTAKGDPKLLLGRTPQGRPLFKHPEFARMSNRPGLGKAAAASIGRGLARFKENLAYGDVPDVLTLGSRKLPLDKYMKDAMRDAMGMPKGATLAKIQANQDRMHDVRKAAEKNGLTVSAYTKIEGQKIAKIMKARYEALKQEKNL